MTLRVCVFIKLQSLPFPLGFFLPQFSGISITPDTPTDTQKKHSSKQLKLSSVVKTNITHTLSLSLQSNEIPRQTMNDNQKLPFHLRKQSYKHKLQNFSVNHQSHTLVFFFVALSFFMDLLILYANSHIYCVVFFLFQSQHKKHKRTNKNTHTQQKKAKKIKNEKENKVG